MIHISHPFPFSKVSFRKVENVKPIQHAGVHDAQARSFGCTSALLVVNLSYDLTAAIL